MRTGGKLMMKMMKFLWDNQKGSGEVLGIGISIGVCVILAAVFFSVIYPNIHNSTNTGVVDKVSTKINGVGTTITNN